MPEAGSQLDGVYAAKSPEEVARRYDGWAETYEGEMARIGYRHPAIALALLARHLPRGAGPILDAGAGTGLVGEWLGILGYPEAEALDISPGMLEVAARKGVYRDLHLGALGGPLSFADGRFAAVISAGVFTLGHVGAEALPELLRVVRPGGVLVLTVKDQVWTGGFADRLGALAGEGRVRLLEETPAYVSMPGVPDTAPSRGVTFRVGRLDRVTSRTRATPI
ncbi:MAG: class I SAM-dependent methyltransferase [Rhodobacteraceae bacterium]|nr:class I SAM-dependent methyltransferase [Paracoccaceae bacterium]